MSRLRELIDELCPHGVEYKRVKSLFTKVRGTPITAGKMKEIASPDGEVTIFAGGRTVVRAHEADIPKANVVCHPCVVVQSRGVIDFIYCDTPLTFKNELWAYTADNSTMVKFLYYVLKANVEHFRIIAGEMSSFPQISARDTEEFSIPVPPIEVQREIVRILDSFQELDDALTAEIEAREKQLGELRELRFATLVSGQSCMSTLGAVASKVCSGGTPSSKVSDYYGGDIPWLRTQEVDFSDINDVGMYITELGLKNSAAKWIPSNCLIVAMYGATAGKVAINRLPLTTNQACCNIQLDENIVDLRYVFHWMWMNYATLKGMGEGSQGNINGAKVKAFPIPVPPLSVQKAHALEFDAVLGLRDSLVAERSTRRKQFEYYRDKLLSFPEKVS